MASDWYAYAISSEWMGSDTVGGPRYRMTLTNHSGAVLTGFKIGFSGPARVSDNAPVSNGSVVTRLSNYCELAPPTGLELAPGASWTVSIGKLDYGLRHWTDGANTAFVITHDGQAHLARTEPTANSVVTSARRRGTMAMPVAEPGGAAFSIIPWPNAVSATGNRTAPFGFAIAAEDAVGAAASAGFADLVTHLFPGEGLVRDAAEGGYPVRLESEAGFAGEGYEIVFSHAGATVRASGQAGFFYGLVTLGQMARGARLHPRSFSFPVAGRIVDEPALGWRGCHLDVARRFYSTAEVEQFLRTMAWNKLNRFHWHLSDDEAWRVEIDAYPELTRTAAWRGHGMAIPPLLGSGPEKAGGYYSKAAIREIVALGDALSMAVVPEIDVPGHCYAMITALPQLRDAGENGLYYSIQSFDNNSLNPGVPAVQSVIETIFAEMVELFPAPWFHVGADEVPHDAWQTSPQAQALLKEIGGTTSANLQAHFLRNIQAFLTAKGKVTGAWEEAAEGGGIDKANCYLVGWRNVEANQKLAREGYDVVAAPAQRYYLDMANGPDWQEPGAGWAGWSNPEMTYRFVPGDGWNEGERSHLLGIQGAIWCEPMTDRGVFDRLVYPRLSAIAETGWTREEHKDWARFVGSVGLMPNLYGVRE